MKLSQEFWAGLNFTYLLGILASMCFITSAAMWYQFYDHELPCPLCLLQRLAYFGIGFGVIQIVRNKVSVRYIGYMMLFTLFLLIVAERQSLLDIVVRPNHGWIGSAVLGLHMPIWSVVVSLLLLISYAINFSVLKYNDTFMAIKIEHYPRLKKIASALILYIILLCIVNLIAIVLQCGLYNCHTDSYLLLN